MTGRIEAISVSRKKGVKKINVGAARLQSGHGIVGDAHAGNGKRQVSLLDIKEIVSAREKGVDVDPGGFAENITVSGMDMGELKPGDRFELGSGAVLKLVQVGKNCDKRCGIYHDLGRCSMSENGVFAEVVESGKIGVGDRVVLKR